MIRPIEKKDKEQFLAMLREFYESDAVMAPVPLENHRCTFDAIIEGSPYAEAYIIEKDGEAAGYAQVSLTWSTEAGGLTVWLEELYVREQYRGMGLGHEAFDFIFRRFRGRARRYRLEVEDYNKGAIRLYEKMGFGFMPYLSMYKDI